MYNSDDPSADYDRYDRDRENRLSRLPRCNVCGEHIQDEHYYEFYGETVCEECLVDYCNENYRRANEEL